MKDIPRLDAWILARLRAGLPVDGELSFVSLAHRDLAHALAGAPREQLDAAWESRVTTLPEAEAQALAEAVATIEWDGPPLIPSGWQWPTPGARPSAPA